MMKNLSQDSQVSGPRFEPLTSKNWQCSVCFCCFPSELKVHWEAEAREEESSMVRKSHVTVT
jgi:hypothetical protein